MIDIIIYKFYFLCILRLFVAISKLNVVIMDKKSNKANCFWNSYQSVVLESGIPEILIQRNKLIPRVCLLQ